MPCQVNSILKLKRSQDYPESLVLQATHTATKSGYRILPLDVPLPLVDDEWLAHADVVVHRLTWETQKTTLTFTIAKIYPTPISLR